MCVYYVNHQKNNMKKFIIYFVVAIILATPANLSAKRTYESPVAITRVNNNIVVGVLPQVELMSIIQTISQYPNILSFLMAKDSSNYKTDVINHFTPFRNHPAVKMFDRLSSQPRMLNFSAPTNIMLYTDVNLKLRDDIKFDDFVINRAAGMDSLNLLLDLIRDFAVKSSFNEFYKKHEAFYINIVERTINNLGSINYVNEFETFYGKKQKSYNIVLVSLYSSCGYGNSLKCENDMLELFCTIGPRKVINKSPLFGDPGYLKTMVRHEFSHPFINPLTEKNWDYIKDYSSNYNSIPEMAKKQVCGDWQECINEFIIRSITTQLAYNEGDDLGLKTYISEKSNGVIYIDSLLNKIGYYQLNRDKFPTFESYYLTILDTFKFKSK